MTTRKSSVRLKPRLRTAQTDLTRQRIVEAARDVFCREGYYGATVDQIVAAAEVSRPTFYLYFNGKEKILALLTDQYNSGGAAIMERLPAPRPTPGQLRAWLLEFSEFLEESKALSTLVGEVASHSTTHVNTVEIWIDALSRRAPAFAAATLKTASGTEAYVRAKLLMLSILWAGRLTAVRKKGAVVDMALTMVAQDLYAFLRDPRFGRKTDKGAQ
jgi:AcrR family transcriptional regulator